MECIEQVDEYMKMKVFLMCYDEAVSFALYHLMAPARLEVILSGVQ